MMMQGKKKQPEKMERMKWGIACHEWMKGMDWKVNLVYLFSIWHVFFFFIFIWVWNNRAACFYTNLFFSRAIYLFYPLLDDLILTGSKFADDAINVTEKLKVVLGKFENIVERRENASHQHFLLFVEPTCDERDIVFTMTVWCMCVHMGVRVFEFVWTITCTISK